jgi:hypothetical protein
MDLPNIYETAALKPSRKAPAAFTKVVIKGMYHSIPVGMTWHSIAGLWIRIRIGSVFSDFVYPNPYALFSYLKKNYH